MSKVETEIKTKKKSPVKNDDASWKTGDSNLVERVESGNPEK